MQRFVNECFTLDACNSVDILVLITTTQNLNLVMKINNYKQE